MALAGGGGYYFTLQDAPQEQSAQSFPSPDQDTPALVVDKAAAAPAPLEVADDTVDSAPEDEKKTLPNADLDQLKGEEGGAAVQAPALTSPPPVSLPPRPRARPRARPRPRPKPVQAPASKDEFSDFGGRR